MKIMESIDPDSRVWIKTDIHDGAEGEYLGEAGEPDAHMVRRNNMTLRRNRKHIRELPKETDLGAPIGKGETTEAPPEEIQPTGRSRYGIVLKANPRYKDYVT